MFLVESSDHSSVCPICNGDLIYRDRRPRVRKHEGGEKEWLLLRRLKCSSCNTLHTELPDCLAPYKHYETEVISGVLDGVVTADDVDSEDYPSNSTMKRWILWFWLNLANIEGHLRRAGSRIHHDGEELLYTSESLLDSIRKSYSEWLEIILRIIYNSGGGLPSLVRLLDAPTLIRLSQRPHV